MFKFIATLFAAIFAFAAAHAAGAPSFQTGQRWTVKDSTTIQIVIGRIDPFGDSKTAISISVFGVPCPPTAGCTTTVVAHAPFDSETLATSVDKIVDTNAQTASAFEEG